MNGATIYFSILSGVCLFVGLLKAISSKDCLLMLALGVLAAIFATIAVIFSEVEEQVKSIHLGESKP